MRILQLLPIIILLFSCKKEVVSEPPAIEPTPCDTTFIEIPGIDTIFPSPYLAMYPGSWWNYDNGTNLFSFEWVQIPHKTLEKDGDDCITIKTREIVLPKTSLGLIYGDYEIESNDGFFHYTRLVGEVGVTQEWGVPYDNFSLIYKYETKEVLDSITIHDEVYYDIIVTEETRQIYYPEILGGPIDKKFNYFAKNIGLIYQNEFLYITDEWQEKSLVNYHIAPF
jgi:hypothetical protein